MTIRIRPAQPAIDPERLSALLVPVLLKQPQDDGLSLVERRPGDAWLLWGDATRPAAPAQPSLD